MIDRRLLWNLDWVLVGAVLALSATGVAAILSAGQHGPHADLYLKQLSFLGLGFVCLGASLIPDYRRLVDRAPWLYLAAVVVLAYLLFLGPRVAGTRRWLVLGPMQLQPSEFVKLVAALLLAKFFGETKKESLGLPDVLAPGCAVALLMLLIGAAPDLGTAVCLLPLFIATAFVGGLRAKAVLGLFLVLVLVGGLGWKYALQPYQKARVYTFLDPNLDPKGAGYQRIQSQIAVGSGGLTGKGYLKGTQSQLGYLPARHTDFIFSVLAEEMGFVGVTVVLGLYLLVLWRAMTAALLARDRVGAFLATGVTATLAFQVVYNVGMVAGLLPVKGLPLPFMSYGGSSILASLVGIGFILNVRMRRFAN
jgi:rod shape determining protein RodA